MAIKTIKTILNKFQCDGCRTGFANQFNLDRHNKKACSDRNLKAFMVDLDSMDKSKPEEWPEPKSSSRGRPKHIEEPSFISIEHG